MWTLFIALTIGGFFVEGYDSEAACRDAASQVVGRVYHAPEGDKRDVKAVSCTRSRDA